MSYAIMFHHLHDDIHPKGQGSISESDFKKIIDYICEYYNLLDAREYKHKLENGTLGKDDTCLTFDDSLKCQYDIATPILNSRNISAYYFVYTSVFIDEPDCLEIYRDFRNTAFSNVDEFYKNYFSEFELNYPKKYDDYLNQYPEDYLSDYSFYSEYDKKYRFVRDNVLDSEEYNSLMQNLMILKYYDIASAKHRLWMETHNLVDLINHGHVIGLHSHSHPTAMDHLNYSEQKKEYDKNIELLNDITSTRIWAMSHPCGRYNTDTLKILRELNIEIGFRSNTAVLDIKSSLEVPREDHANIMALIK